MEIIPISQSVINDNETNTVNARDLHKALEIRKDFVTWMKAQINRACLEENVDYMLLPQKGEQLKSGAKWMTEYILTLDSAKHISMMSSSVKGKAIRDYFIEAEKQLRQSTHINISPTMEDLILRQNALLSEVVQELRVTQQAVIDAKDETIQVQREAMEMLSNANQITINKTTVKTKNALFPGIAEEVFVEAASALLKRFKSGLNQSQLLAHLGRLRGDNTARQWLQKHIGVYWDIKPSSNRQYIYTLIEG